MAKTLVKMDWYKIDNIDQVDSPALVVYPERVKENIALAKKMLGEGAHSSRLRPHVKTHKSPDITRLFLEAGVQKFKCATIAEAEMLAISGAGDVLLAYQPVGPKLQRLISLIQKYPATKFSGLIDDPAAATAMDQAFLANHLHVPVYLDLNLGMNRTGITPGEAAVQLYKKFSGGQRGGGITPVGLHAYDGHIRDADLEQRTRNCDAAFDRVTALRDVLAGQGLPEPVIVAGGSPTFSIHSKRPGIECSPGTFVYWDKGYQDLCPEQPFKPAALVITRVISLPDATKLCLDLGHKSVAAENELSRRVVFLNAPELTMVSQSEEHLVAETGGAHRFQTGDVLYGLPYHICPTVSQYERVITIEKGRFTGEWKNLARDRKISV
jgi:D-serine deaminase-like pyridoxal phosphate-dependent protein